MNPHIHTGRNKYRLAQKTPIPNFTLAGDWTSQKFLGSMEGAGNKCLYFSFYLYVFFVYVFVGYCLYLFVFVCVFVYF